MDLTHTVFTALWLFLPAGAGNAAPILVAKLPHLHTWETPLDLGFSWDGQRLLGPHKTWRGLLSGMAAAMATLWLQQLLAHVFPALGTALVGVPHLSVLALVVLGPLLGFGALAGDAVESFFKRRRGIAPGQRWLPFDQMDYIIGAEIASLAIVRLPLAIYVAGLVLWPLLHVATSYVGYRLQLRERAL